MTNRRFAVLAFAVLTLGVTLLSPADASAQSIWDRMRDRIEDRNQRRDDDYGRRRDGRVSDRERRVLRDVANRLDDRTRDFQRNLDRLLDNSRYDDTRREDNINANVRTLRGAAARFRDRAGDSNDRYRGSDEARRLLDAAAQVNRSLRRVRLDGRTASDWSQIRNDLRTVADIYNIRFRDSDYDGRYDGNEGRGRRW